jgi:biopolymer transport protein ExbB/biopolymer transport protein TolQ
MQKLVFVAQSGASAVLYLLLFLSVISIGVVIERWWYFRKRRLNLESAAADLEKQLRAGNVEAARKELGKSKSVEAEIVCDALVWYADGAEAVQEIVQKGVRQRRKVFEGSLLFLGTLGNNAPFVGLFGTVLGVIAAFRELGAAQANMAAAGGGMNNVMSGIAEALVATAIGILVAIPAVIAFNIFQKRGTDIEENSAALSNVIVASMAAQRHNGVGKGKGKGVVADDGKDDLAAAGGHRNSGVTA